jgi:hypothetical protein
MIAQTSGTHIWESRRFELMYTIQGKTWPTRHTHSMLNFMKGCYALTTWTKHISRGQRIATFHEVVNNGRQSHCSREKGSRHNPQHNDWPIRGSVPSFSPEPAIEAVEVKPPSIDGRLLGLLSPYHRYAIDMLNTCSRGPTHRSLTDTGGGYSLGGAGFPHISPRPSQPAVSTFHLRAPPSLRLINPSHSN